jgi:hypothetical protein
MLRDLKGLLIALCLTLVSSCVSLGPAPAEQIIGTWQSSVGAFPLTVVYGAETVQLGDSAPVPYQLDGDRLTYAEGGQQVRIISFPESSKMQQLDPITGTAHTFSRVNP